MASESIGSIYPTQIPGYDDAADIKAALKLYHYGSVTVPTVDEIGTDPGEIVANSVAGHLKALDTRIDLVEAVGVGSDYATTEPVSPADGFIWVDANSTAPTPTSPNWQLISSGSMLGASISVSGIDGQKFYILLNNWSHNNTIDDGLRIRFNSISTASYVLYPDSTPANGFDLGEVTDSSTQVNIISVDLSATASLVKPVAITGTGESHTGYFINSTAITSAQISLANGGSFDSGTYQVWSYE
jgi:hypothetical protein